MWQYRAYVMDSVSSDQAIITSHRHSSMHTYMYTILMHHAYIVYHTIPFLIRRIFRLLVSSPFFTQL